METMRERVKTAVVVSDNHGDKDCIAWLEKTYKDADYFIHAGDSEMHANELQKWICVQGNNDWRGEYAEGKVVTIDSNRILLVHGHQFWGIYNDMLDLCEYAKENECSTVIFGHIHRYVDRQMHGIHLLNPGSITYPRYSPERTYMLLKISDQGIKAEKKIYKEPKGNRKLTFF